MSTYRQGTVLGLTVAEVFILLTFLLLMALLGLVQSDEPPSDPDTDNVPMVWVRPDEIKTLVASAEQAHKDREQAEHARAAAEQARAAAERERDQYRTKLTKLSLLHRKGENPPCWYKVVPAGAGKTREKPHPVFNVAIYENTIKLARTTVPDGGATDDDGGGTYADEWKRLRIDELPYGKALSDNEFREAVHGLSAQGKNQQVRPYKCVFYVRVWDKTPVNAKERWKYAHDRLIEGLFSAYTVRDLKWTGVD